MSIKKTGKTLNQAQLKYMEDFYKKMEDIRILKDTFSFKRSVVAGGYDWISYSSEELYKQAKAMALILNFEIKEAEYPEETGFVLGIKLKP